MRTSALPKRMGRSRVLRAHSGWCWACLPCQTAANKSPSSTTTSLHTVTEKLVTCRKSVSFSQPTGFCLFWGAYALA